MRTQRQLVDYALRRRALLAEVRVGRTSTMDVCDANPYLLRAARFHGEPGQQPCPLCDGELVNTNWIFGDVLGPASGSARSRTELEKMTELFSEFNVYVVEVCPSCHWNHLVQSYVLGTGATSDGERGTRNRKRKTAGQ
ncbi:DUF5318 family protein [Sciscionella marina]|uniref:DUF5318 family protein n=1 Tax=Sciscionella marina TaxID=508770 RepID=UPI000478240C|nr:DUF5318 family protein [Sciscionella marina]